MPRTALSTDDLESMRKRLASVALAIYLEDGLEAVSLRRIAEAAGISHTLPYRYFADKDALLARVRVGLFGRFESELRGREIAAGPLRERVHSIAYAYVDFARQRPAEYRLMFASEQPPPDRYPALLAARRSLFEHAVELMQHFIDRDEVVGDARLLTHSMWINLHGLMSLYVVNQLVHGCTLEELMEPLIEQVLAANSVAQRKAPSKSSTGKAVRPATRTKFARRGPRAFAKN